MRPLLLSWLLSAAALSAWLPAAVAQPLRDAPFGPDLTASRDLEVRVDALPDQFAVEQIEFVVEASDEYCKPKYRKVMGINLPLVTIPHAPFFCRAIETYVEASPADRRPLLSRQIWQERRVAAHVAQLDLPLSKRYVALTRWRPFGGVEQRGRWVVEELLWDREQAKLLWHALRSIYIDDEYEKGRVWGIQLQLKRYYEYELAAVLGRRGEVRSFSPVPASRWVPAAEIPMWASEHRAAIALVNTYRVARERLSADSRRIPIRADGQAPFQFKKFEWGQASWFQHELSPEPAITPRMDYGTHALLEVPPGKYWIRSEWWHKGEGQAVELKAGQLVVVNITHRLIGQDDPVIEDFAWWTKWLERRSRHAFLEDQRPFVPNVYVESWFQGP